MASNSDGLWNGAEASIGLEVEPEFWQTWWFRLACVLAAGLATLAIYLLRMRQVTRLMNVRFEERLAERGRIAQDLHDNLLQGVLSLSMQLQVAADQLPADSPARTRMNRILQLTKQVVDEGRKTLRGLRSSIENPDDLLTSLSQIPNELGEQQMPFRIVVEGSPRPLRPAIRDEVYSIGREALLNAFRHSMADNVDLRLEYRGNELRMQVRDDGRGVDSRVIDSGRDAHLGLLRMHERAERIGAKIKVLSRAGDGTEVEVRVPNRVAFETPRPTWVARWMLKFQQRHQGGARRIPKPDVG
jgi:signal transduction histidine kinase